MIDKLLGFNRIKAHMQEYDPDAFDKLVIILCVTIIILASVLVALLAS